MTIQNVISACVSAVTASDYRAAKNKAARLPVAEQFQAIDHLIACRRRLEASGVLVRYSPTQGDELARASRLAA